MFHKRSLGSGLVSDLKVTYISKLGLIITVFVENLFISSAPSEAAPFGLKYGMDESEVLKVIPAGKGPAYNRERNENICAHLSTMNDLDTLFKIGKQPQNIDELKRVLLVEQKWHRIVLPS